MPLKPPLSDEYLERFAAWIRVEPRCRHDDFTEGIRARVADPLWMLARQWQTGELLGEDAGSPIRVGVRHRLQAADRVRLGDEVHGFDGTVPLETLVEQSCFELDHRERVQVGQEFERRLRIHLEQNGKGGEVPTILDELRARDTVGFPCTPRPGVHELDRSTQRLVSFMRGKVVDGAAVLSVEDFAAPSGNSITQAELADLRAEVATWYATICSRPGQPPQAWQADELSHRFEVHREPAEDGVRLVAQDYRNGTVDWYTFSADAQASGPWQEPAASPLVATPTRIQVSGNAPRWWAFEDGNTDFGAIDVAKVDLAKLLLMEFALIYGDDWFSVPIPVPLGNLVRIDDLWVDNVFGERIHVPPARRVEGRPAQRFDVFSLSPLGDPLAPGVVVDAGGGEPSVPMLYIPAIAGFRQESAALEEVRFLRDEGANMVWGVEHTVPNGRGVPVAGVDAQRERLEREAEVELQALEAEVVTLQRQLDDGPLPDATQTALLNQLHLALARLEELRPNARSPHPQGSAHRFRLATQVPANWIPFVPSLRRRISDTQRAEFALRRAQMLLNTDHARWEAGQPVAPAPVTSMSRLLALDDHPVLWLREEAIPRAGVRVQLTKQRTRWTDGTTHVWLGRKVLTGRGEGASGLRFDQVRR